jgi:hypothetical protein
MEIVIVQLLVSLGLVAGSLILYAVSVKQADAEHADRLSLLPLDDDRSDR